MTEESRQMAEIAVRALEDKKGEKIVVYDISDISPLADCFIIVNGTNKSQIQALSDNVYEKMSASGYHPKQIEGYDKSNWILLDYRDIVIHIFDQESRSYYNLERIWRDASTVLI